MHIIEQQLNYLRSQGLYDEFLAEVLAGNSFLTIDEFNSNSSASIADMLYWQKCKGNWDAVHHDLVAKYDRNAFPNDVYREHIVPASEYPEFYL